MAVPEAPMERGDAGLRPTGPGWFVVNAREAAWIHTDQLGSAVVFEGRDEAAFSQVGINIQVLQPGQPNCMYHGESSEEHFLVLSGECLLLIEGEERRLKAWDFVHCPPFAEHVFVGAGNGPCVILMVGYRDPDERIVYPVSELAQRHDAGVDRHTTAAREAYAALPPPDPGPYRAGSLPGD